MNGAVGLPSATSGVEGDHEAARLQLARISLAAGKTRRQALQEVAEIAAAVLQVDRISIWQFIDQRNAIRCEFLFQPASRIVSEGTILHTRDFPNYFQTLATRRFVPVVDTDGDPITEEFRQPYFTPLGISAMLDAAIYQAGDVVGIVCHEQIGAIRDWSEQACEFAATVADVIARLLEEAGRLQAESAADSYQTQVLELQRLGQMGRLAAGMAHDFNNVLQVMLTYVDEIAIATQGQPKVANSVNGLLKASERGVNLVRELQALGRDQLSRPRVTEPDRAIDQIRDLLGKAAGPGITLTVDTPMPIGRVFIDPSQLERVVLNLVMNARDAMASGGEITISLTEMTRTVRGRGEAIYVVVEVRDTGVGMDAATQARIFEPLFTTKGDKGTGLGLAVVHHIVALAGGFIEVDSEVGRGTSVRIHLPRIA